MKGKILTIFKEYLILTIASFIFAAAWECFMIPNGMSAGGMMGLCTIIQYATADAIPAQVSYIAINAVLMVIAVLAMGIGFGFKTVYCILVSTLAMSLISGIEVLHSVPGEFLYIEERVLVPIFAGVLEAVGIGLILRFGGSTGGSDIVALMINKYWPVSLSTTFLIMDLFICAALLLLPGKTFSDMCYGLEMLVVFSFMVDMVVGGKKSSYQLFVFSEKYDVIADYIINKMERGVTVIQAQGWYTKKTKEVLMILISQKELPSLNKAIKAIDPRAFMSISTTNNVYGEGFEEMKTGVKLTKKKRDKKDEH